MHNTLILLVFLVFISCSNSDPQCILDEIENFQNVQSDCVGAAVKKYRFQEQILYGFLDGQCIQDGGTSLFDEDCSPFCFVGGIGALTDCNGVNFFMNAEEIEEIWVNK